MFNDFFKEFEPSVSVGDFLERLTASVFTAGNQVKYEKPHDGEYFYGQEDLIKLWQHGSNERYRIFFEQAAHEGLIGSKINNGKSLAENATQAFLLALKDEIVLRCIKIEPRIETALEYAKIECGSENQFKSPYILKALLSLNGSLLRKAFNNLRPSLGDFYFEKAKVYIHSKGKHTGAYLDFKLDSFPFIINAKGIAYDEGCLLATERHVILGLFATTSNWINQIRLELGSDFNRVEQFIRGVDEDKGTTIGVYFNKVGGNNF